MARGWSSQVLKYVTMEAGNHLSDMLKATNKMDGKHNVGAPENNWTG